MNASLDSGLIEAKPKEKRTSLDKLGLYISIISSVVGSLLLVSFLVSKEQELIRIGIIYLAIAFFTNLIFFLILVIVFIAERGKTMSHPKTAGVMLLNIPIAFGYFMIVLGVEGI
ncbi:MAG: hypothetical protein HKN39_08645 [Flavobacteriales bacterium]|nr:hypothetical protein [Flavobacteriales bacterium]